jgi:fructose-bisphosphate aldolase class II
MAPLDIPPGVVTGDNLLKLFEHARENCYAIPAVNCSSSSTCNAVLEAAKKANSPIILQVSQGGGAFFGGKSLKDDSKTLPISGAGSIAMALHIRAVAPFYGIPVVIHSDHCAKKLLPWFDQMLAADKKYFDQFGEPLFSSHMLDLSEETDEENIAICVKYFEKMAPLKLFLEMEIGITGGEEDGVNNENVDPEKLYTTPQQVNAVYNALIKVSPMFSIAAAFGNVHGVYKPGNVVLSPHKLGEHQAYTRQQLGCAEKKPIFLVMHGGSGSTKEEIQMAVSFGTVKMNIDTDTQWAYWNGIRAFESKNHDYLQGQIGNPKGADKPNKSFYDPRKFIRAAEESMAARVMEALDQLNTTGKLGEGYSSVVATSPAPNALPFTPTPPPEAPSPVVPMACAAIAGVVIGMFLSKSM